MTPHAESTDQAGDDYTPRAGTPATPYANGSSHPGRNRTAKNSLLKPVSKDDIHDLVCVGFGPASLAIAVALNDALDGSDPALSMPGAQSSPPKVCFLEKQGDFAWHAGMLLPGAKMQITFIKDMATLRNPRSQFTFLNYLHQNNRLVEFTNLSTFLPQRIEYEDYMRWCASHFRDAVDYDQEVIAVTPEKSVNVNGRTSVQTFVVTSKNTKTGWISARRTRHVLIAAGGKPSIPQSLPQSHPRVLHSSQCAHATARLLTDPQHPYKVAVIGGGQSAAEIFDNIQSQYPNSRTSLIIKGAALRPSDDSPFVNEVFNPSRVDDIYRQTPSKRTAAIAQDRSTNYGVVRIELLEKIYEHLYTQRIRCSSESEWPHRILPHRTVTWISDSPTLQDGVRLHIENASGDFFVDEQSSPRQETLDVDVVFVATGYKRDTHEDILKDARFLMAGGDEEGKKWTVRRDYRVEVDQSLVSPEAGIWLQGCNESTHGVSTSYS